MAAVPAVPAIADLARTSGKVTQMGIQVHNWGNYANVVKLIKSNVLGKIAEGHFADLVLFDPATVIDHATFTKPQEFPVGIEKVFVNGVLVWNDAKSTGATPGLIITR